MKPSKSREFNQIGLPPPTRRRREKNQPDNTLSISRAELSIEIPASIQSITSIANNPLHDIPLDFSPISESDISVPNNFDPPVAQSSETPLDSPHIVQSSETPLSDSLPLVQVSETPVAVKTRMSFQTELDFRVFAETPCEHTLVIDRVRKVGDRSYISYACADPACSFRLNGSGKSEDSTWTVRHVPHSSNCVSEPPKSCRFRSRTLDLIIQPLLDARLATNKREILVVLEARGIYRDIMADVSSRKLDRRILECRKNIIPMEYILDICRLYEKTGLANVTTFFATDTSNSAFPSTSTPASSSSIGSTASFVPTVSTSSTSATSLETPSSSSSSLSVSPTSSVEQISEITDMRYSSNSLPAQFPARLASTNTYSHMFVAFPWAKNMWRTHIIPRTVSMDFTHCEGGVMATATVKLAGCKVLTIAFGHVGGNESLLSWEKFLLFLEEHFPGMLSHPSIIKTDGFPGVGALLARLGTAVHVRCIWHLGDSIQKLVKGPSLRSWLCWAARQNAFSTFVSGLSIGYEKNEKIIEYVCPALAFAFKNNITIDYDFKPEEEATDDPMPLSSLTRRHSDSDGDEDEDGIPDDSSDDENISEPDVSPNVEMVNIPSGGVWIPPPGFQWNQKSIMSTCPVIWSTVHLQTLNLTVSGDCTSNTCESFHSVIKRDRHRPFPSNIFFVVETCFRQLQKIYTLIDKESPAPLLKKFNLNFLKREAKSMDYVLVSNSIVKNVDGTIISCKVSSLQGIADVSNHKTVNFLEKSCSCLWWQTFLVPCVHPLAAIRTITSITKNDLLSDIMSLPKIERTLQLFFESSPRLPTPSEISDIKRIPSLFPKISLPVLPTPKGRPRGKRIRSILEVSAKRGRAL